MRSIVFPLAVLVVSAFAASPDCVTKDNTVIEFYDQTITKTVYVTEGAIPTTKRKKHSHKPKPKPTYQPPPPPDYEVVTVTHKPQEPPSYEPAPEPEPKPEAPHFDGDKPSGGSSPQEITDAHNFYRLKFGCNPVQWDDELASFAHRHASQCQFSHSGGPYGENLAMGSGGYTAVQAVNSWSGEFYEYSYNNPGFSMGTGHFTQVIWKGTEKIGCGFVECGGSNIVVCEYSPAGNVQGNYEGNVPGLLSGESMPAP